MLLAAEMKVELLLISTAVEKVAINFNKPNVQWLDKMTLSEAKKYQAEGHFLSGSMGPKIEAMIAFLEANPNGKGLITDPPNIANAGWMGRRGLGWCRMISRQVDKLGSRQVTGTLDS